MTRPAGRTCSVRVYTANGTAVARRPSTALTGGLFTLAGIARTFAVPHAGQRHPTVEPTETYSISMTLDAGSDAACRLRDPYAVITLVSDE
ncbi:MAG: hypothetical protein R2731_05780 [Nocardioides sp.]